MQYRRLLNVILLIFFAVIAAILLAPHLAALWRSFASGMDCAGIAFVLMLLLGITVRPK